MPSGFGHPITEPTNGWARVSLVRGQSGGASWAIDSQYTEARLSIGSAPDAGWQVTGIGVAPVHFELFWDGRSLWIADTRQAGGVTLNGRAITDWVQLRGRVEVSFGSAGMMVETSDAAPQEMASNPGHATRVTLMPELTADKRGTGSMNIKSLEEAPRGSWDPLPDEATRVASGPIGSGPGERPSRPDLDPETTRIASEGAFPTLSGVAPRIGAAPAGASGVAPPPPPGLMRPRLGGGPGPSAPAAPGRPMASTIAGQEMSPHVAEATRIAAGLADAGPSVQLQAGYPGGISAGGFPQGGFQPGHSGAQTAPALSAPGIGPGGGNGPLGGFAAPPTFDQAHAQQTEGKDGKKGKQALPMRTWALLGVTVVAAAGLMMMGPREVEVEQPAVAPGVPAALPTAGQPSAGQPTPGQPTPGQPIAGQPTPGQPTPGQPIAGQPTPGQPIAGQPIAGQPTPGQPIAGQPTPGQPTGEPGATAGQPTAGTPPAAGTPAALTEDRQAADLVIAGRWDEALPRYRALAAQHPERPEYAQMIRILERRLAGRCQGGVGPDGRPCSPGGAR